MIDIGGRSANSAYVTLPYTITAIGPPDLYERLQQSVAFVQFVRERIEPVGIQLSVANLERADPRAFAGTVGLQFKPGGRPVTREGGRGAGRPGSHGGPALEPPDRRCRRRAAESS